MIITDQERDKLISEVKSPVIPLRGGIKLKKKLGYAWEEAKIDLIGGKGHKFRIILRKNTIDSLNFCLTLLYIHEKTKEKKVLIRFNRKSHHTNRLEKKTINCYHIHILTERYQRSHQINKKYKEDGYAECTDMYTTFEEARNVFLQKCNIKLTHKDNTSLLQYMGGDNN